MNKFKISNKPLRLLGNSRPGLVFVISAPAGTGKTTLVRLLCQEFPQDICESVSCTTRTPRINEQEGVDYYFLTPDQFDKKLKENAFIEHAAVFDHRYGTLYAEINGKTDQGRHVVLVIDTQGAMSIKKHLQAVFIFIAPPSLEELERRLRLRQTETEQSLVKRLAWAKKEMLMASNYDYVVVNEDLETAYEVLKSIVIAEEHRNRHKTVT